MFHSPTLQTFNANQALLYQTALERKPALEKQLEAVGLTHLMAQFCEINHSVFSPYHNAYHSFFVTDMVAQGAAFHRIDLTCTRALFAAALFHDVNHSAGKHIDAINIEQALLAIDKVTDLNQSEHALAKQLIQATLRPSVEGAQWSLLESILRDADLMQAYEVNDEVMTALYAGLHSEIERSLNKPMNKREFANFSRDWMDANIHWDSQWAKEKSITKNWTAVKGRLDTLLQARHLNDK